MSSAVRVRVLSGPGFDLCTKGCQICIFLINCWVRDSLLKLLLRDLDNGEMMCSSVSAHEASWNENEL